MEQSFRIWEPHHLQNRSYLERTISFTHQEWYLISSRIQSEMPKSGDRMVYAPNKNPKNETEWVCVETISEDVTWRKEVTFMSLYEILEPPAYKAAVTPELWTQEIPYAKFIGKDFRSVDALVDADKKKKVERRKPWWEQKDPTPVYDSKTARSKYGPDFISMDYGIDQDGKKPFDGVVDECAYFNRGDLRNINDVIREIIGDSFDKYGREPKDSDKANFDKNFPNIDWTKK